ncbi:1-aminocyclopropane-1-carboxylate oxidase homolog 1-like protein [Tanacetum coccineum]
MSGCWEYADLTFPSIIRTNLHTIFITTMATIMPSVISSYDRASEIKAFDKTKSGVKGLVDAGIQEIPRIFMNPPEPIPKSTTSFDIPLIDLASTNRALIVESIRTASKNLGFFQVVNHGIPISIMNEMLQGVRRFHEQDAEVKKQFYTRDVSKAFVYNSNFDLYSSPAANWRDSFFSIMAPNPPKPEELPVICRDIQIEYSSRVLKLGELLFGFISEALGLETNHLGDMECDKGLAFVGHFYPACPQPELTIGTTKHTDDGFLTVLLQDDIGGLEILHENEWIDVPRTPGALVINIGDLLQVYLLVYRVKCALRYDVVP